ncbi:MAG: hypothetical protein L0H64_23970 [Pseudonocardia sp.]|nr:hypothetical protein [Pseudonocardia sp.]
MNAAVPTMPRATPRVHDQPEPAPERVPAPGDPAREVRAQLIEGSPVMACACGAGLRWSQMRRPARLRPDEPSAGFRVDPICCERCAGQP